MTSQQLSSSEVNLLLETSLKMLSKEMHDLSKKQEDFFEKLYDEHKQMTKAQQTLSKEQQGIVKELKYMRDDLQEMATLQQKTSDEQHKKFQTFSLTISTEIQNISRTKGTQPKELASQDQQKKHEYEVRVLTNRERASRQVSVEMQKLTSKNLFKLTDMLNALSHQVKCLTEKQGEIQEASVVQIKQIKGLIESGKCVGGGQFLGGGKCESGAFINEEHFCGTACVENGNLFLGDVSVDGHVIGQLDLNEFFENNKASFKTEIININHWKVNHLRKMRESGLFRRTQYHKNTSNIGTMTDTMEVGIKPAEPELFAPHQISEGLSEKNKTVQESIDKSVSLTSDQSKVEHPRLMQPIPECSAEPELFAPHQITEENSEKSKTVQENIDKSKLYRSDQSKVEHPRLMQQIPECNDQPVESSKSGTTREQVKPNQKVRRKDVLFVLGGEKSKGIVETFSESEESWVCREDIPDGPSNETLAVNFGHVILVVECFNKRTRSLNILSKEWKVLRNLPVYRRGMTGTAEANRVYLIGGKGHLNRCDVYNVHLDSWSKGPKLNVGREYSSSATLAERIYCCGGLDGKRRLSSAMESYEPRNDSKRSWFPVADMSVRRSDLTLVACTRFLWAVGGFEGPACGKALERYDPERNSWTKMESMKAGRTDLSGCFCSGRLYVIGGYTGPEREEVTTVEIYDPEKDRWSQGVSLNTARALLASCVIQEFS